MTVRGGVSLQIQIYKEIGLDFRIYTEIRFPQSITFQIYMEIENLQNRPFAHNFSNL